MVSIRFHFLRSCNKRPNATPFKLSDLTEVVVAEDTGRSRTCFTVEANPDVDTSVGRAAPEVERRCCKARCPSTACVPIREP